MNSEYDKREKELDKMTMARNMVEVFDKIEG